MWTHRQRITGGLWALFRFGSRRWITLCTYHNEEQQHEHVDDTTERSFGTATRQEKTDPPAPVSRYGTTTYIGFSIVIVQICAHGQQKITLEHRQRTLNRAVAWNYSYWNPLRPASDGPEELNSHSFSAAYIKANTLYVWPRKVSFNPYVHLPHTWKPIQSAS